ncbi:MAG: TRAP transporter substrate-binding protein, partial [Myxococcales bacterium]|nr:TRAP transporter substrate-binding protein [Myxococcales bacterium]
APEGTPWEKQLQSFRRHIKNATGGRVQVKMFMGGSLGGEKALVRRTAQGNIQAFAGSTAALGSLVREMNVIESPYLFDDAEQADRALDSAPVLAQVRGAVERRGFRFGFWAENGFRSWFTKERPIRTPADLRGLRMRSQEATVHLETYRAFGANPVPIDVTNVLQSLQTGVVDGFDNTPLFAFATSWYQATGHLTLSRHSYQPGIIVFSKSWYDGLPSDIQAAIDSVPASLVAEGRNSVRRMDPILVRNLERYGIDVHTPSASERRTFADVSRPVADRVARKAGSGGRDLLRAIRAAR